MGIQFFKKVNGNGQVYYNQRKPDGSTQVCQLPQQRPTGYDSDDDIYDEGFQDQMASDPFFNGGGHFNDNIRPNKRRKIQLGQMVRVFYSFISFYDLFLFS